MIGWQHVLGFSFLSIFSEDHVVAGVSGLEVARCSAQQYIACTVLLNAHSADGDRTGIVPGVYSKHQIRQTFRGWAGNRSYVSTRAVAYHITLVDGQMRGGKVHCLRTSSTSPAFTQNMPAPATTTLVGAQPKAQCTTALLYSKPYLELEKIVGSAPSQSFTPAVWLEEWGIWAERTPSSNESAANTLFFVSSANLRPTVLRLRPESTSLHVVWQPYFTYLSQGRPVATSASNSHCSKWLYQLQRQLSYFVDSCILLAVSKVSKLASM